jgi:uncharacterized protein
MKIVIAGGSGFVGRQVAETCSREGFLVTILSRQPAADSQMASLSHRTLHWDGQQVGPWAKECDGADVVLNLSGASIAERRWTPRRKGDLTDSRVQSTQTLLQAIESWKTKPHTFLSASGIGFYGDRGSDRVDEKTPPGTGFLPQLCQAWESAAMEGERLGLRVIPMRFGMVLGRDGGALAKMTGPFRLFLGGPILPGSQYVSWIHQEDLTRLMLLLIATPSVRGPVNAVAPEPITMRDFCAALGSALHRPSWLPVPKTVLRIALGELATMLTTGQRVSPRKALDAGFTFSYGTIEPALDTLFRPSPRGN